jgi:hypothetical protein
MVPGSKTTARPSRPKGSAPKVPSGATHGPAAGSRNLTAPRGAMGTPDARGGTSYRTSDGTEFHVGSTGRLTSIITRNGTTAHFASNGRIASIYANHGMTIRRGPNNQERIETLRPDGTRIVNTGRHNGYVDHTFVRDGSPVMRRTYVVNGRSYAVVYRSYHYGGRVYYGYVPGYFYAPAFYGWAYSPWAAPVYWGWGWSAAPWYGYYGYYFAPYPYYAGPAFWLTDYLLAANLQEAYEAQADTSSSAVPQQFAPWPIVRVVANRYLGLRSFGTRNATACNFETAPGHEHLIAAKSSTIIQLFLWGV